MRKIKRYQNKRSEMEPAKNLSFANSVNALSNNLLKLIQPGQHFISPLSLSMALSMMFEGANTTSTNGKESMAEHLSKVLKVKQNKETRLTMVNELSETFKNNQKFTMTMANGIFFNKNLTPNEQFLSVLKENYDSEVKNMQFGGTSHELVNKWIEEKTNGCIKDMLDNIDELTVCLIINAIYFKAKWKKKFKANDTYDREFNCVASEGAKPEKKEVKMMNFFDGVPLAYHTDNDGNLFFMMPYECDKGKNVSMIVMLPNESDASSINGSFKLDNKEQSLTDLLNLYSDHSKFRELMLVKLSFPKFKYKYKINLNDILN